MSFQRKANFFNLNLIQFLNLFMYIDFKGVLATRNINELFHFYSFSYLRKMLLINLADNLFKDTEKEKK